MYRASGFPQFLANVPISIYGRHAFSPATAQVNGVSMGTVKQLRLSLAASDDSALTEARALFR